MSNLRISLLGAAVLACIVVLAGCQTPESTTSVGQIPTITKLYEKATAVQVHRFRKPLRERRARALRQLATECDAMIADLGGTEASAEALTGSVAEESSPSLKRALAQLSAAAREGDDQAMRTAHRSALTAYSRSQ